MAEAELSERLQPALLDRLADDAPESRTEPRAARVLDMRRLRECVHRDLSWLLNTTDNSLVIDRSQHPHAYGSVLNYGVAQTAGTFSTEERAIRIRDSITDAIRNFEPRILSRTITVEMHEEGIGSDAVLVFEIRADMWAQPMPLELYLRSSVDISTGEVTVENVV